jgi:hypothetical protein
VGLGDCLPPLTSEYFVLSWFTKKQKFCKLFGGKKKKQVNEAVTPRLALLRFVMVPSVACVKYRGWYPCEAASTCF